MVALHEHLPFGEDAVGECGSRGVPQHQIDRAARGMFQVGDQRTGVLRREPDTRFQADRDIEIAVGMRLPARRAS